MRNLLVLCLLLTGCGSTRLDWPVYGEKAGIKVRFPAPPIEKEDPVSHEMRYLCPMIKEGGKWVALTKENGSRPATSYDNLCILEASASDVFEARGVTADFQVRRGYPEDAGSPKPVKDKQGREWKEYHWFWTDAMAKNPRSTLMQRNRYLIDGKKVYKLNVMGALGAEETAYFFDTFEIVK